MYTQQQKRKMNTEVWMAQSGLMRSYQLLLSSLLNPTSRFSDPVEAEQNLHIKGWWQEQSHSLWKPYGMDTRGEEILISTSLPPTQIFLLSRADTRWEGLLPAEMVEFKPEIYKKSVEPIEMMSHGELNNQNRSITTHHNLLHWINVLCEYKYTFIIGIVTIGGSTLSK